MKFFITLLPINGNTAPKADKPKNTMSFNTKKDSTYYKTYEKLKSLYLDMVQSECYKEVKAKTNDFRSKLKAADGSHPKSIGQKSGLMEWVKVNLKKTKFKDFKEAEDDYDELTALHLQCDKEHPEYADLSVKATLQYGPDMFIELQMEMINKYGYLLYDN